MFQISSPGVVDDTAHIQHSAVYKVNIKHLCWQRVLSTREEEEHPFIIKSKVQYGQLLIRYHVC